MEIWIIGDRSRAYDESGIIGGNTKHLYELGPTDTIIGNTAYTNRGGSPWANSNVMAKVAGVVKTNTSVFPERRDDGWCARLETRMESVKVFGLVDIEVVAAGSVFLGTVHEPIKGTKNPQAMLNSGVAFTKKPKALRFDYKVKLAPEKDRIRSTGFSRKDDRCRTGFDRSHSFAPETFGKIKMEIFIPNVSGQWCSVIRNPATVG